MGCTPAKVKDTNKIPAINTHPSRLVPTTSLANIANTASQITPQDYDQIMRYDIPVRDERPTPTRIERIDFINK